MREAVLLEMQRSTIFPNCPSFPALKSDLVVEEVLRVAAVHKTKVLRDGLVENDPADGGVDDFRLFSVWPSIHFCERAPGWALWMLHISPS